MNMDTDTPKSTLIEIIHSTNKPLFYFIRLMQNLIKILLLNKKALFFHYNNMLSIVNFKEIFYFVEVVWNGMSLCQFTTKKISTFL